VKRLLTVYQRAARLFVSSHSRTVDGIWVATWDAVLPADAPDEDLMALVAEALGRSGGQVPTPARDADHAWGLLDLAGVKTFRAFAQGMVAVRIVQDEGMITVTPLHKEDPRGWLSDLTDLAQSLPVGSPSLGQVVRAALARAT
jgi:hypothetical protein